MLALSLAAAPPVAADDWNGSYAADGSCYCSGSLPTSISNTLVPTPIGSQTVDSVCERVGSGPGLSKLNGVFDQVLYPDAQCGHGPFAAGTSLLDKSCAGTHEPGNAEDCQAVGPRWNLALAYAEPAAESEELTQLAMTAPDVPSEEIVTIDGQEWRQGPEGTAASGGAAGSRIILDGTVWLKSDNPIFARLDAERSIVVTEAAKQTVPRRIAPSAATPPPESPEELRARQPVLVAEARERTRQRAEASLVQDDKSTPTSVEDALSTTDVVDDTSVAELDGTTDLHSEDSRTGAVSLSSANPVDTAPQAESEEAPVEAVAESLDSDQGSTEAESSPLSALRLPTDVRGSSDEFGYVQAMPLSYDIGGAGLQVEGSAELNNRLHVVARGATADSYRELMIGAGFHYTPPSADRMTLMLTGGLEYGEFPLARGDIEIDATDTGLWLGAASRIVINPRFELEGGVGYSSFYEGDPVAFGGAFFHVNRHVDLMSRFELGDNDSFGIGLRVYY